jgi:ketosteroid isomerase-like protein
MSLSPGVGLKSQMEETVPQLERQEIARETYGAYASGDRSLLERHLAPEFGFYSPADVGIDLARYWERCWPNAQLVAAFEFERLATVADQVVVTYEATRVDGTRFRNTEILTFEGDKIVRAEVYFGWELAPSPS